MPMSCAETALTSQPSLRCATADASGPSSLAAARPVAHDERAAGEVAKPLIAPGEEDAGHPDSVERRQDVDEAHDVAHAAGHEGDRQPAGAHDPQPGPALAERLPVRADLEQHVVAEPDEEEGDREQPPAQPARLPTEHAGDEPGGDHERALDQQVEERGDETRADPGQPELDVDAFRRRDPDPVLILHRGVKLDRFVEERRPGWTGLEALLRTAGAKPERLGPERLRRLGSLYRAAAADLAFARRAFPHDPVTRRLERLVADGRQAVYADQARAARCGGSCDRVLAAHPGAAVGARSRRWCCCSRRSRSRRSGRSTTRPRRSAWCRPSSGRGRPGGGAGATSAGDQAGLSREIFTNNIRVTFLAIAGGIFAGLGRPRC